MNREVHRRVNLVAELREAIAGGQLFLVYQPQVDVDSGRITGLEALARWRHPTRGIVLPRSFIPAAEDSGLIGPLGNWVLAEVCRQARQWLDEGIAPDRVAVNFSPLQFRRPRELWNDITGILAKTGLPPQMLEIELTETTLMGATRSQSHVLEELRQLGIRIAIDDFGTGYSALNYLRQFPVDRIKLARGFISDLDGDAIGAAVVQAALSFTKILGIDLVVEGVETDRELDLLKSWGCRTAQGFYFAKPMPAEDVARMLREEVADGSRTGGRAA
jgi:EAL domain-containing protein (putative c-di-GMP-specific phosphodiesterase class I)